MEHGSIRAGQALGARRWHRGQRPRPMATPLTMWPRPLRASVPAPGGARSVREGSAQRSGDWLPRPCPALIGGSAGPAGLARSKGGRAASMEAVLCTEHGEGRCGGPREGRCDGGLGLTGSALLRSAGSLCFLKTGVRDGPNKGKSFYVCGTHSSAACDFVLPAP